MAPSLSDPFTANDLNGPVTINDVDPFANLTPKPSLAESLAVHESFEMPGTPTEMCSPRSDPGATVGEVRDGVWYEVNLARQALGGGLGREGEREDVFSADD
jgi:hypothetical protein